MGGSLNLWLWEASSVLKSEDTTPLVIKEKIDIVLGLCLCHLVVSRVRMIPH
jgi:hypothetical protein